MKMLEYEYDPKIIIDNLHIDNQNKYNEFLESIREEVVKRGSVRIFIPGNKYNSISSYHDAFYERSRLLRSDNDGQIFTRRIRTKLDPKGRKVIEYRLKKDRGTHLGTVYGKNRAIVKVEIILQGDPSKDISDPECDAEIVIKATIVNWGEEYGNSGRKKSIIVLKFDKNDLTLKQGNKKFEAVNTDEMSRRIAEFLSKMGGE